MPKTQEMKDQCACIYLLTVVANKNENKSSELSDPPDPDFKNFFVLFLKQPLHCFYVFLERIYKWGNERTDIICETNDHLSSFGLVGQKLGVFLSFLARVIF